MRRKSFRALKNSSQLRFTIWVVKIMILLGVPEISGAVLD